MEVVLPGISRRARRATGGYLGRVQPTDLRALLPKALGVLSDALDEISPDQINVALAVLKLAGPLPLVADEPTDPEEIVRRVVDAERERHRTHNDDTCDVFDGRPKYDDHMNEVRKRLARMSASD